MTITLLRMYIHLPLSECTSTLDPIYIQHPSARHDLQSLLTLAPASPAHTPVSIENYCVTGVHSSTSSATCNYDIYIYLSNDYDALT